MAKIATFSSLLAAVTLAASCSGSSKSPAASSATGTPAPLAVKFTSATYGYTITPPAGWVTVQAERRWDGQSGLVIASPLVDEFLSTDTRGAWAVARPWHRDLAAYTNFFIAKTNQYHGGLCPAKPDVTIPVTIGGEPGVLLGYACGILINEAATVHHGVAYQFVFKDDHVQAATNPADQAVFVRMLSSVQFPN